MYLAAAIGIFKFLSHLSGDEAVRQSDVGSKLFLSHLSGDEELLATASSFFCVSKSPER